MSFDFSFPPHLKEIFIELFLNVTKPIRQKELYVFRKIKIVEKITYHELILLGYEPINKWSNLQDINQGELNDFANDESLSIDYSPSIGVKENMDAKKVFYQKIIFNGSCY